MSNAIQPYQPEDEKPVDTPLQTLINQLADEMEQTTKVSTKASMQEIYQLAQTLDEDDVWGRTMVFNMLEAMGQRPKKFAEATKRALERRFGIDAELEQTKTDRSFEIVVIEEETDGR